MAFAPCLSTHSCESFGLVVRRENRTLPSADQDLQTLCGVARLRYSRTHLIFLGCQATAFLAESCSLNCSCVRVAAGGASLGAWRCWVATGFLFSICFIWATLIWGQDEWFSARCHWVFCLFYLFYLGFACSSTGTGTGGAIALSQIHLRE